MDYKDYKITCSNCKLVVFRKMDRFEAWAEWSGVRCPQCKKGRLKATLDHS